MNIASSIDAGDASGNVNFALGETLPHNDGSARTFRRARMKSRALASEIIARKDQQPDEVDLMQRVSNAK